MSLLAVSSLSAGYGAFNVLDGVSLNVEAGEIVALLGSNGAGKSTLNNALCGVIRARGGAVTFDARDITRARPEATVAAGLIQVPEGRRIFPNLSVEENLLLGAYRRGAAARAQNIVSTYETFPRLNERARQFAGTLSGGEQQMLAIGRGLMAEPKLMILDEPSLGLSPLRVEEMFALIDKLRERGVSILLVEQNVMQSLRIASRAYVLENGRIVMEGASSELLGRDDLRKAYLGM